MALVLLQNATAVRDTGIPVPFQAIGGTAPYVYSVLGGGAGGTINSSTGIYLSPLGSTGTDIIEAVDASANVIMGSIAVLLPIELVADIIQTQASQQGNVWLYEQKINIPTDSGTYIVVGLRSHKTFGNRTRYEGGSGSFAAVQSVNVQQILSIDLLSRSTLPLSDVDNILMALSSPYAESQEELNSFYVAPVPQSIVNISGIDGPAIPYHLQFSVSLTYFSTISSAPSYFSNFGSPSIISNP